MYILKLEWITIWVDLKTRKARLFISVSADFQFLSSRNWKPVVPRNEWSLRGADCNYIKYLLCGDWMATTGYAIQNLKPLIGQFQSDLRLKVTATWQWQFISGMCEMCSCPQSNFRRLGSDPCGPGLSHVSKRVQGASLWNSYAFTPLNQIHKNLHAIFCLF